VAKSTSPPMRKRRIDRLVPSRAPTRSRAAPQRTQGRRRPAAGPLGRAVKGPGSEYKPRARSPTRRPSWPAARRWTLAPAPTASRLDLCIGRGRRLPRRRRRHHQTQHAQTQTSHSTATHGYSRAQASPAVSRRGSVQPVLPLSSRSLPATMPTRGQPSPCQFAQVPQVRSAPLW